MSEPERAFKQIQTQPDVRICNECNELAEDSYRYIDEELQYYHRSEVIPEIEKLIK